MAGEIRVCLFLEGSYPFITGGVSAWVHDIIRGLPEIDFRLFTISPEADQELRYELPENITDHVDVVISNTPRNTARPRRKRRFLSKIRGIHDVMFGGNDADVGGILAALPEGYFLSRDAVRSGTGWNLITDANVRHNPLYPFSDYFWAWKSSHDMLFAVLGASPPAADIYHAVSTGFAGMAAYAAKIRRGKPFLLTEHGLYHKEREMEIRKASFVRGYQRDMWTKMYNRISRICYTHADMVTALFEENRRKQIEMGSPPEKTFVVPNGIDIDRFRVKRERRPGFHVGLVGRVVPIKDIKTFIATAKIVLDEYDDTTFYCIGPTDEDPGYYEDCRALVGSLKIQERFIFTGRQNVLEYYSFLDVLMLTSVREAQPLVILEAYAAGIPVVSTRVGNVPEMLDYDDRFIASSKDSEKLASGIRFLHDHPGELGELVEKNRRRLESFYDKRDLLAKYREMYSGLAGRSPGSGDA